MNIILCGFMGSGKTTVARELERLTQFKAVDMDQLIEEKEGKTISQIFSQYGEAHFRSIERKLAEELSLTDNLIVATGGGAILNPQTVSAFKKNGTIVFLNIDAQTVLNRLQNDTTRPLLQREDKESAVRELLTSRLPVYKAAADIIIDSNQNPQDIASEICKLLC